jgi:hypothetical protein
MKTIEEGTSDPGSTAAPPHRRPCSNCAWHWGPLGALNPVATVLLGSLVLHERMLPVQRIGVTLALGGIVLLALA